MPASTDTLKQEIKREVMAELQQRIQPGYVPYSGSAYYPKFTYNYPAPGAVQSSYRYSPVQSANPYAPALSPAELTSIKQEVMRDIQEEMHDGGYHSMAPVPDPYNRTIMDSVKNQLLAEIEVERSNRIAQASGYGQFLSDRNINRAIDQRYRTLDQIRDEVRKELQAINRLEKRSVNTDPQIRDIAHTIAWEARSQGMPLEEVIRQLNTAPGQGLGWWNRVTSMVNTGQRRGFLYGVGLAAIVALLWPSARNNLHSVAVRSLEEGMSLADRARSFVGRKQETMDTGFASVQTDNGNNRSKPEIDFIDQ